MCFHFYKKNSFFVEVVKTTKDNELVINESLDALGGKRVVLFVRRIPIAVFISAGATCV